jgi:TMEM175 potassium channel family protein
MVLVHLPYGEAGSSVLSGGDGSARDVRGRGVGDRSDAADPQRRCALRAGLRSGEHQILHEWPAYVAYVASFSTIGIIWANHHTMMVQIGRADRSFLMLTIAFLMIVAFIPFPTRVVAEHITELTNHNDRAAAVLYGLTLTLTAVMFNLVWFYAARRGRLLRDDADPRVVRGISRTFVFGPWIYLALTIIAAARPRFGAVGFLVFALFWVIESSVFGRDRGPQDVEPRGTRGSIEKIVAHVADAERGNLYALGSRPPKERDLRRTIAGVLAARSRGEAPERVPRTGKLWSPRYFVRRTAWHALDHAWEIEDRLQPKT